MTLPSHITDNIFCLTAFDYLGCWADNFTSRDSPSKAMGAVMFMLREQQLNDRTNRMLTKCARTAHQRSYSVFGIFNHSSCVSSAHARMTYTKFGRSSQCLNGTGGPNENSVYSLEGRLEVYFGLVEGGLGYSFCSRH